MKLLVTAGATREAIDPVRYLSNVSTGATGAALAAALHQRGHEVLLLSGAGAVPAGGGVASARFLSAQDLRDQLRAELSGGDYDAVIMAAAVADYRPAVAAAGKLSSDEAELILKLVRNEKILPQLRGFSPRPIKVIGFKLTVGADDQARAAAVRAQFARGGVDAVVHNDLAEICSHGVHPFRWFTSVESSRELSDVPALTAVLDAFLREACR